MYRAILTILYLIILASCIMGLIRNRDSPAYRRLYAAIGVGGILLAPTLAGILYELLATVFTVGLFLLIVCSAIAMIFRSIFRFR